MNTHPICEECGQMAGTNPTCPTCVKEMEEILDALLEDITELRLTEAEFAAVKQSGGLRIWKPRVQEVKP